MNGNSPKIDKNSENVREMTCICCPVGCQLTVVRDGSGLVTVTGNTCKRGADYGEKEMVRPTRILTTTVRAAGQENRVVPVKTASDIPREKIWECIRILAGVTAALPVRVGDVIVENIADTGVNIVATRDMEQEQQSKAGKV